MLFGGVCVCVCEIYVRTYQCGEISSNLIAAELPTAYRQWGQRGSRAVCSILIWAARFSRAINFSAVMWVLAAEIECALLAEQTKCEEGDSHRGGQWDRWGKEGKQEAPPVESSTKKNKILPTLSASREEYERSSFAERSRSP